MKSLGILLLLLGMSSTSCFVTTPRVTPSLASKEGVNAIKRSAGLHLNPRTLIKKQDFLNFFARNGRLAAVRMQSEAETTDPAPSTLPAWLLPFVVPALGGCLGFR